MSALVTVRNPAPTGGATLPSHLSTPEFCEALRPLLALLNLSPEDVIVDDFQVTAEAVTLLSVTPIAGIEPQPSSGDPLARCWVWPVRLRVLR